MGDVGLVEGSHSAASHVVVLSIDDVEFLAGVDDGLDDLLGSLGVPLGGLLGHQMPVVVGGNHLVEGTGTANLSGGAHDALDVDDVVLLEALVSQPLDSALALQRHIGDNGGNVQALIGLDGAVEEDDLDASGLGVHQNGVPTGGASGGEEQIVNLVLHELLSSSDLLVVLEAIEEGSVVAVLFAEDALEVGVVSSAVAGLVGVVVDDADLDEIAGGGVVGGISGVSGIFGGISGIGGIGGIGSVGSVGGGGRVIGGGRRRTSAGSQAKDHGADQKQSEQFLHVSELLSFTHDCT